MSNSLLISYMKISPNKSSPRNKPIDRITPHCVVGQCYAPQIGEIFQNTARKASCNYGIGKDGKIILVVDEKDRSWCSSNAANDNRAITFEIASGTTHPYAITDAALRATIDLCEDICRRYGKTRLLWLVDKDKTLAYQPKANEMVFTVHRWFANKACPGQYIMDRLPTIAAEVTRRLNQKEESQVTYKQWKAFMIQYRKELQDNDCGEWSKAAREWCIQNKIFAGGGSGADGQPNYMWHDLLTREQAAALFYRFAQLNGLAQ